MWDRLPRLVISRSETREEFRGAACEPWAVRHRVVRGTRPLTRHGSLDQETALAESLGDFRYESVS